MRLLRAVSLGVGLGCFGRMVLGVVMVTIRNMRVMGSFLMIPAFMMLGGFFMVPSGVLMMLSSFLVMISSYL